MRFDETQLGASSPSAQLRMLGYRDEVERERDQARSDWLRPMELVLPRPLIPAEDRNPGTAHLRNKR